MILVTGGAGFIGSNLVARLVEEGERVAVCDRFGHGEKWRNLAKHDIEALVDPQDLDRFLERSGESLSFVFHMGAISATTESDTDLIASTNIRVPQRIWRWCTARQIPLIYASSAATYGDGREGFGDTEDLEALGRLRPMNPYGWSKLMFDRWAVRQAADPETRPPQWAGLKFFNVYGPNEYHKGEMMSVVAKAYPGAASGEPVRLFRSHHPDYADGGQMRDFVYVEDCVEVMCWLRERREVSGLFNVGTGRAQSWLEMMGALYESVGTELKVSWVDTPAEIRDRYQYFTQASMEKLRDAGYRAPFLSVQEGVPRYVEDYLSREDPYR